MLAYGIISIILASITLIACIVLIVGAILSVVQDKDTAYGVIFIFIVGVLSIIWLITAILLVIRC